MDSLKEPYISNELLEYLETTFNIDTLLAEDMDPVSQIGYIKGVRDIIGHLRALKEEQEENE